ncbi:tRNA (N6-isopentenyl adenosine(37)-C2)-methylthiotransferase MiaB [Thermodesulfobacterium hydrogeniphilum]|uniref:tRNA (N6-isopentenyl adenosine(37)-C2)-methylthiotransferase MiaB n=1 Tax=Thermodesulfobacterium hydrogeniphilum TaxID=161156 RepID=UPI00056E4CC1|nr:tRNA (N6-isopentenyl adenosine(37)-C2)-methylthiotransferase MiaB [Thermodesulfobacterium hydrogeniphilum]
MKKRVYIKTFGCQMNENDTEKMYILLSDEYEPTLNPEEADLILINTCSVREKPQHKVYSEVGRYKSLKKKNPDLIIGITGCVAQQEGENLIKKLPYVDLVLGTQGFYFIREALKTYKKTKKPVVFTELKPDFKFPLILESENNSIFKDRKVSAFVTIMQGCDNFCTYCIVPYVRGREISRPPEDILKEVETLVKKGVREIILLGQNVNSYGLKEKNFPNFPDLLNMVSEIEGVWRIRFTTSHPKDLSDKLIEVIATNPKVCKHIHLPLQAGSNKILKLMNRKYTKEYYLAKVEKLKSLVPEIAITTDLIVGFPGETEEDFKETLEMLEKVRYHEIFSFKYSDRPFTVAQKMENKIPEEEKERRLKEVHKVQAKITEEIYKSYVGKEVEVLVEGASKKNPDMLMGRTTTNVIVNFKAPRLDLKGAIVKVLIDEAGKHSLKGTYLKTIRS